MSGAEDPVSSLLDGPRLSQALPSVAVILAAGIAESVLVRQAVARPVGTIAVLAVHVASVSLAACGLWLLRRHGRDCRLSVFAVIAMAAAGPLGATAALLTFLLHGLLRLRSGRVDNRYGQLFPDLPERRAEVLAREVAEGRLSVKPPDGVLSFVDVVTLGSFEQKQAAISRISARFRPEFAASLGQALRDPESALRVQAATVASRIEKNFDQQSVELECRLSSGDSTVRPALALHLDRMAHSGLIDNHRSRAFRERALALWQSSETDVPNDETDLAIVRCLLRLGRPDDACAWFERRDRADSLMPRLAAWRLESLFLMRRYTDLRAQCARYGEAVTSSTELTANIRAAVHLWGTGT